MRSNIYNVTPTRTLRGALCGALGTAGGTLLWLLVAAISAVLYPLYWCGAQIRERAALPFEEGRSIVWCTVIVLGALASFVTVAELWPAFDLVGTRLAAYAGGKP